MSVQDERELRERLGGLLDAIEPVPAPVFRAMRQGRGIRMRRRISAVAGVAALAGVAAAVPFLMHQQGRAIPAAKLHYSVTVNQPSVRWRPGVIATGTENGHDWSVVIHGHGNNTTVTGGGGTNGLGDVAPLAGSPVQISEGWGGGTNKAPTYTFIGIVARNVTDVQVFLSNRKTLTLFPVMFDRLRFIALTMPMSARIYRAEAFDGAAELVYSIPYHWTDLNYWMPPGQSGPARATKTIGSGVVHRRPWTIQAQFGPWGYCFTLPGGSMCSSGQSPPYQIAPGHVDVQMSCQPFGGTTPQFVMNALRPDVRQVVVSFHGQPRATIRPVEVAGMHFLLIVIRQHASITSAIAYNASGQRLGSLSDTTCGN